MKHKKEKQNFGNHRGQFGRPTEKAKDFKGTAKRLASYLKPMKIRLIMIFLLAIVSQVFTVVGPKILGKATTKLFEGLMKKYMHLPNASIDFKYISNILILVIVLYVVSSLFLYIQQYIMSEIAQKTVQNMRKDLSDKLDNLPLKYFDSHSHGDVLSRVTNDIDNIANTLQQSLTQLITSVIAIIGVIIMMLTISPLLTGVTLITLPVSVISTIFIAKYSQKYFSSQQKVIGEINGHVEEMFTGHKIVKAFGLEEKSTVKFNSLTDRLYEHAFKAQFLSGIIFPLMNFINNIGYVIVCVTGGILVAKGKIKIGDIQAFIQYSRQFGQPIVQTANIASVIQSTIASAERVFEILDEKEEEKEDIYPATLDRAKGEVTFNNVNFGYEKDSPLIKDLSLNVLEGQSIAIVGPTGAGKTTLVNLLMRFYDIASGEILIDKVNTTNLSRSNVRKLFGMVLQDTWLFTGSIRDNIAYGKDGASDEEIINACKAAHADSFIRTLPEGYNTVLNEDISNISQGQKQLLTIARAILANPSILILDEATSNIDTRTEVQIQKAMKNLMQNRTSFIIAHRLSTIKEADLILVMNNGEIIEKGNHAELLNKQGFYFNLYNSQFSEDEAV